MNLGEQTLLMPCCLGILPIVYMTATLFIPVLSRLTNPLLRSLLLISLVCIDKLPDDQSGVSLHQVRPGV